MSPYAIPGVTVLRRPTMIEIENVVCEFYGEQLEDVYSKDRYPHLVWCRHLIAYFAMEFLDMTLKDIGKHIHRHHATVIGSRRAVQNRIDTEQFSSAEVKEIRKRIYERSCQQ